MPKRHLTEEEKYKAKVRKESKIDIGDKEGEKIVDFMWQRKEEKTLKNLEENFGKNLGLKRKKIENRPSIEQIGPGLWRDVPPQGPKQKLKKTIGEPLYPLKWI